MIFNSQKIKFFVLFLGFSALLGVLIPLDTFSATIFEDDFDTYANGTLAGQGGWLCDYTTWSVIGTEYESSPKSIRDDASSFVSECHKTGASTTEGSFSFWFKTTDCGYGGSRREELVFRFTGYPYGSLPNFNIKSTAETGCEISLSNFGAVEYVAMDTFDSWTQISFFWKLEGADYWYKWRWGANAETAWGQSIYTTGHFPTGFDRIEIYGTYGAGGNYFFVDTIEEAVNYCGTFTDFNSCTSAGCFWGYGSLYVGGLPTGYCTDMPTGVCGSGYDDCQNCVSQATCEAEDFCFWYLDTCRYGETACAGTSPPLRRGSPSAVSCRP
jgi:hypothetical protein